VKLRRTFVKWAIVIAVALAVLAVWRGIASTYVDWLWFDSLGQLATYLTRFWARLVLWLVSLSLVLAVLGVNWLVIPREALASARLQLRDRRGRGITIGPRRITFVIGLIATLVGLLLASEAAGRWMAALGMWFGGSFGYSDPVFGLDAGFYVFDLPFLRFLVGWFLVLLAVALLGAGLIYLLSGRIRSKGTAIHLAVLGALFLLVKAVDYQFQRFGLLQSSGGVTFGAGYADVQARVPLLHVLTGVVVLCAVLLVANVFVKRWRWSLIVAAAWVALAFAGPFYPELVQRYTVKPNELALERPYITHNIEATRYAYNLDDVEESDYPVSGELSAATLAASSDTIENVRLWDWRPLRTTFEQLQEIRTYYTFVDVDVDRYKIDGRLREVMLAVRELDIRQLREEAQTWINEHLIYTHGYGLCLIPVGEVSPEGLPNLLVRDLPPTATSPELAIARPEIYFGEATSNYIVVNSNEDEFDFPQGDTNVYARYEGPDGVRLGGLLRRLVFASHFDSNPLLISTAVDGDSRVLFRRDLWTRVNTLAPMLWYDDDPYPVIFDGRIVWIYDAYTWTTAFPYSTPGWSAEPVWDLNYVRNSVKVTVDAYTGETTFYVVDPSDPIVQSYVAMFPRLFTPVEDMPEGLRAHWRYPEQLFEIQADIYAAYHMQDPRVFYNQEDLWQTPTELVEAGEALMSPYYVIMRLPGRTEPEFMMIRPYVPAGKQNMIAWLYADSDGDNYGRMGVYKFSKESLVYGPIQVEARMDQDAYISQQLTLWNQRGSSVIRGNLIVIPIDGTLLYIEPLYLQAETGRLPELTRVLVAHGNRVAMAEDLESGLAQVLGVESAGEIEVLPGDVGSLARSAQQRFRAAQECLLRGDWECYGEQLELLEADLNSLVESTQ
jgi:uncharacterized membrane protein (UPF0182 family)